MTPVAKTGLHCGVPAGRDRAALLAVVTPVAKTGLHCGEKDRPKGKLLRTLVTPVAKTGLHCGDSNFVDSCVELLGDPGREDRAPLRRLHLRREPGPDRHVTPVAKTGLHCGNVYPVDGTTITIE